MSRCSTLHTWLPYRACTWLALSWTKIAGLGLQICTWIWAKFKRFLNTFWTSMNCGNRLTRKRKWWACWTKCRNPCYNHHLINLKEMTNTENKVILTCLLFFELWPYFFISLTFKASRWEILLQILSWFIVQFGDCISISSLANSSANVSMSKGWL